MLPFICHSGLALSPAQNSTTIKSLPQQNVAMTKHAFCRWYSFTDMIAKTGLAMQFSVMTHQLQYDKTFPLFAKGVAARI